MEGGTGSGLAGSAANVILGLANVSSVVAATSVNLDKNHSLALDSGGGVWGWGRNGSFGSLGLYGALGTPSGSADVIVTPIRIPSLGTGTQIQACGTTASLLLHSDGTVWMVPSTWDHHTDVVTSRQIAELSGVAYIGPQSLPTASQSQWSLCDVPIVGRDGSLRLLSIDDQVASGVTTITTTVSTAIANLPAIKQATCKFYSNPAVGNCLALATDGTLWSWGANCEGELGDGTSTGRTIPAAIPGLPTIKSIAMSDKVSFALGENGSLYTWGIFDGPHGRGQGQTSNSFYLPGLALSSVSTFAAGNTHACALKLDGSVWCWGDNRTGGVGDGTLVNRNVPVQVVGVNLN